ncbi:MAG: tyrosine/phenylalanine carboxypeptidase domain-containing protein, partial [Polyangiaceae bacterium]
MRQELTSPPKWEPQASRLIDEASRNIRLLGCVTPINLRAEVAALRKAYDNGQPRLPRFEYGRADYGALVNQLERGAAELEALPQDALKSLYIDRTRELTLEAKLCMTVGTEAFGGLANERYPRRDSFDEAADALCHEWLRAADESSHAADAEPTIRSDDALDPRSLLSQMRSMVGARRLGVRVVVSSRLAALAATGPGAVYVASGHMLTATAAHRTVLHEIEGHVLPRIRAAQAALGIFRSGTRYGSDDQEGRALCIEDKAGFLLATRRAELARR